jgi:hypothetical protein
MAITITAEERDALYGRLEVEIAAFDELVVAVSRKDFEFANEIAWSVSDALRVMVELRWGTVVAESIELSSPPDVLRRVFDRLLVIAERHAEILVPEWMERDLALGQARSIEAVTRRVLSVLDVREEVEQAAESMGQSRWSRLRPGRKRANLRRPITIKGPTRDVVYECLELDLSGFVPLLPILERSDFETASRIALDISAALRVIAQDLGWGNGEGGRTVELNSPPDALRRVFTRLRDSAIGHRESERPDREEVREAEQRDLGIERVAIRVLAALGPEEDSEPVAVGPR